MTLYVDWSCQPSYSDRRLGSMIDHCFSYPERQLTHILVPLPLVNPLLSTVLKDGNKRRGVEEIQRLLDIDQYHQLNRCRVT